MLIQPCQPRISVFAGRLVGLRSLALDNNALATLPACICDLSSLERLTVDSNQLRSPTKHQLRSWWLTSPTNWWITSPLPGGSRPRPGGPHPSNYAPYWVLTSP